MESNGSGQEGYMKSNGSGQEGYMVSNGSGQVDRWKVMEVVRKDI